MGFTTSIAIKPRSARHWSVGRTRFAISSSRPREMSPDWRPALMLERPTFDAVQSTRDAAIEALIEDVRKFLSDERWKMMEFAEVRTREMERQLHVLRGLPPQKRGRRSKPKSHDVRIGSAVAALLRLVSSSRPGNGGKAAIPPAA